MITSYQHQPEHVPNTPWNCFRSLFPANCISLGFFLILSVVGTLYQQMWLKLLVWYPSNRSSQVYHPRVLKELATELGPVFAHLFKQSIDKGEIPKEWSLANICPLFKKGDRSLACNYRPVSLTCVPCKLLEHIVCSNIMAHLDEHRLLSEKQHAFRKWHSCETQLITVIDDWAKILNNQGQVDTFILDFEKAFDTPLMNFSKANCLAMELEEKL